MDSVVDQPPRILVYIGVVTFVTFPFIMLWMFGYFTITLIFEVITHSESVVLEKGALYCLGGVIGLLAVGYDVLYQRLKKKHMPDKMTKIVGYFLYTGMFLFFLLPHAVHFSLEPYLKSQGYEICREASKRWLHSVTIVYTQPGMCEQIVASK